MANISSTDFNESPYLAIWETTRSCALKCIHCRAEAIDQRDPLELSTDEAKKLLEEIRRFGPILVVLTGGDPMRRPDALSLVEYGSRLGLRMTMTPSGTNEMTFEKVKALKEKGLARIAVSLDGSSASIHDRFRQVDGSYDWTMQIIQWANEIGLPVQINTTISRHNWDDLENLCRLMTSLKIVLWSVFLLVPTGRAKLEDEIRGVHFEKLFQRLADLAQKSPFDIKTTEAPHYRRVLIQRAERGTGPRDSAVKAGSFIWQSKAEGGIGRSSKGVNDGNGFVFISHTGAIWPSGFLPVTAGNVRKDSLVDIYRHSELFKSFRDKSLLKGKCGACEYKTSCGGSRARAYALTGDVLESDPFCVYVPKGYAIQTEEKKYW